MTVKRFEVRITGVNRDAVRALDGVGDAAGRAERDLRGIGDGVDAGRIGRELGDDLGRGIDQGVDGGDLGRDLGNELGDGVDGAGIGAGIGDDLGDGAAGGLGGAKGKVLGVLSTIGRAGATSAVAIGASIGIAMGIGFSEALAEEEQNGKFAAQLGGSPEYAAEMGALSSQMYRDAWGDSLGEVQEAMRGVLQHGVVSEDADNGEIERLTGKVLALSEAFDGDLNMATQAVGTILRNDLAGSADEALDILTRGMQQGADKAGDLLETFQEYGAGFEKLGIDAATATGLMTQGVAAGARDADSVADALREFSILGQEASDSTREAFEAIGLDADDLIAKVAAGGPEAASALDMALDGLRGMEDPVERNAAAVALFGAKAEELGESLFALDPDRATARLGELGGAADAVVDNLDTNTDAIERFKRKGLGLLTDFVGGTALPAFERFHEKVMPIFDDLLGAWRDEGFSGVADRLGGMWDQAWPKIQEKGRQLFERIRTWIVTEGPGVAQRVGQMLNGAGEWLLANYPGFIAKMGEFYGRVINWVAEVGMPRLGEWMKTTGGPALWQWIQDAYPQAVAFMGEMWAMIGTWLATTAVPWMHEKGQELMDALTEWAVTEAGPALVRGFESMKAAVGEWIVGTAVPWLAEKAGELWGTLREQAEEKGGEAVDWLKGLPDLITDALGDLGGLLLDAGADLIGGFIDGIESKIDDLAGTLEGLPGGGLIGGALEWGAGHLPGRASGGRVLAGHPYIVGERRPELFVPDRSGTIVPRVPDMASSAPDGQPLIVQVVVPDGRILAELTDVGVLARRVDQVRRGAR